jgi:hypothetical protein
MSKSMKILKGWERVPTGGIKKYNDKFWHIFTHKWVRYGGSVCSRHIGDLVEDVNTVIRKK